MSYHLEIPCLGKWNRFKTGSKGYCQGYMDALRGEWPRSEVRMVDDSGKVIDQFGEEIRVSIGQVAGWPTAEQYERAANEAIEKARLIRENEARKERK
jgi:hypothetical protein